MSNMYLEHLTQKAVNVSDKNPVILDESANLADAEEVRR